MENVTRDRDSPGSGRGTQRGPFGTELMRLKRRGCCVLVTGQISERVRAAQSRQLFGEIDEPRQRVLALTDATPTGTVRYLPDGITPTQSNVTVLDHTDCARDATSVANTSTAPSEFCADSHAHTHAYTQPHTANVDRESSELGCQFGTTLCESVRAAIQNDRLGSGSNELRLGVATLGTLISTDGRSATQAFVRAVRTDVLAVNGMGHFHLPGSPDAETLDMLRSVVDIHLELRESQPHVPEHRWHLLAANRSTDWLPM